MRDLVLGDVHGALPALQQVFERSKFDKDKDRLICLGDVCDGWPYVPECFDLILEAKNLTYIVGNHDWWAYMYYAGILPSDQQEYWLKQGGFATLYAYKDKKEQLEKHLNLLQDAPHVIEENNVVFVHGGIDPNKSIIKQEPYECMWNRGLLQSARHKHFQKPDYKYGGYEDIFIGHTSTESFRTTEPAHFCNVWDIDTGAGWSGKLTIMDVKTKEYWQSDCVLDLMPGIQGRQKLRFE